MTRQWLQWEIKGFQLQLWEVEFRSCHFHLHCKNKAEHMENKQTLLAYQRTEVPGLTVAANCEKAWKSRVRDLLLTLNRAHTEVLFAAIPLDISYEHFRTFLCAWCWRLNLRTGWGGTNTVLPSHNPNLACAWCMFRQKVRQEKTKQEERKYPKKNYTQHRLWKHSRTKISIIDMLIALVEKVGRLQKHVGSSKWWGDSEGRARKEKRNPSQAHLCWAHS